ncbi:VOC family protein [Demequina activiva]|uniref:Bleomycin resistance protein n=1 Tax=Demequina activiva TaxID=1582364 RepID=A0A919Q5L8_9MICO|nr:VOC family protein [Demequina activiva]GIG54953.1 bleomycin resistance protein [Demequina activiva]
MADAENPHTHHAPDYIEIPALDTDQSVAFYGAAFGWSFTQYGPEYFGIVAGDGREVGGISGVGAVSRGDLLVVLFSRDIEASRDAVVAAGGTVTHDIFDFPGGRRFHFADPSGNELGVWSLV